MAPHDAISDSELNVRFAWNGVGVEPDYVDLFDTFQKIRSKGRLPTGKNPRVRSFPEIVDAVAQDADLGDASVIYTAAFWGRLSDKPDSAAQAIDACDAKLDEFGLMRWPDVMEVAWLPPDPQRTHIKLYRACLHRSLALVPYLEIPEVLWRLRRLTVGPRNAAQRMELTSCLEQWFEAFFASLFPYPLHLGYTKLVCDAMLGDRVAGSEEDANLNLAGHAVVLPKDPSMVPENQPSLFGRIWGL